MALDCSKITAKENTWLKYGSTGTEVEELQKLLKQNGFYTQYKVDGKFQGGTQQAVKDYQKKKGLSQDGKVGPVTCKSINNVTTQTKTEGFDCPNTDLQAGKTNDVNLVKKLQTGLKSLGYYTTYKSGGVTKQYKVDGYYGQATKEAVAAFQRAVGGLSPDGWFGPATCKRFNEKLGWTAKKTETKKTVTVTKKKTEEIVIDAKKVNFLTAKESNFSIDGVYLISSSVEDTRSVENGDWQVLEMMGDKTYTYMGHSQPREYDVTCYLRAKDYSQIRQSLILMTKKVCDVKGTGLTGGKYVLNWTFSIENHYWRKIIFHLVQYRG